MMAGINPQPSFFHFMLNYLYSPGDLELYRGIHHLGFLKSVLILSCNYEVTGQMA